MAKLARVLLAREPTLLDGIEVEGHVNDVCSQVVQKWIESLQSFYANDAITIHAGYSPYNNHSSEDSSRIGVSLSTSFEGPFHLKAFVDSDVDYRLSTEAIRALNAIAYDGLEIWTPDVIRSMYAQHEWFGEEDDVGFSNAWQEYNDEPMEENSGRLMPSSWDDTLASSGYLPLDTKPSLKATELAKYMKSADTRVVTLTKAVSNVFALAAKQRLPNSSEGYTETVEPSFCFLWDEDEMLAEAIDEVINERWNSGESTEAQFEFGICQNTDDVDVGHDIRYLEHLIEVQLAVGNLRKAMAAFLP